MWHIFNSISIQNYAAVSKSVQEAQLLLTNCTTHLRKCNSVAKLTKTRLCVILMCHHATSGHSRSNHVRVSSREYTTLGSAKTMLPWDGWRGWPPKTCAYPYVLPRPIWSFFCKECSEDRGEPHKVESAGAPPLCDRGVNDPLTKPPPHMCYMSNLVVLHQRVYT